MNIQTGNPWGSISNTYSSRGIGVMPILCYRIDTWLKADLHCALMGVHFGGYASLPCINWQKSATLHVMKQVL